MKKLNESHDFTLEWMRLNYLGAYAKTRLSATVTLMFTILPVIDRYLVFRNCMKLFYKKEKRIIGKCVYLHSVFWTEKKQSKINNLKTST